MDSGQVLMRKMGPSTLRQGPDTTAGCEALEAGIEWGGLTNDSVGMADSQDPPRWESLSHTEGGEKKSQRKSLCQLGPSSWHGGGGHATVQWVDGHPGAHQCTVWSPNTFHTHAEKLPEKSRYSSLFNDHPLTKGH